MNTYFDYLAFFTLFFLPALLAIYAFRIFRERSLSAVETYRLDTDRDGPNRWVYKDTARSTSGLQCRRPFMAIPSQWFLVEDGRPKFLTVVPWKNFNDKDAHWSERWYKENEYYLLVQRSDWTFHRWLLAGMMPLVALIAVGLWLNFHPGAFSAAPEPEPTQVAAESTIAPRPTATPEPEPEVIEQGADVLVIDLDREASPAEVWEWLDKNLRRGGSIPINWQPPEWLVQLFGEPMTVIKIGAGGYMFVANTEFGMEFIRTDDEFRQIGSPEFVMSDAATVTAGEFHWGVSFDTQKIQWRRPVNSYRGNVELVVFNDVFDPAMIVRGRGVVHNLWVEVPLVLVSLAFLGLLAYAQGTKRR